MKNAANPHGCRESINSKRIKSVGVGLDQPVNIKLNTKIKPEIEIHAIIAFIFYLYLSWNF